MNIKNIDHIGIAVKSIEQAGKFYTDVLGLDIEDIETVAEQKTRWTGGKIYRKTG